MVAVGKKPVNIEPVNVLNEMMMMIGKGAGTELDSANAQNDNRWWKAPIYTFDLFPLAISTFSVYPILDTPNPG